MVVPGAPFLITNVNVLTAGMREVTVVEGRRAGPSEHR
jgi:hypothetical protein